MPVSVDLNFQRLILRWLHRCGTWKITNPAHALLAIHRAVDLDSNHKEVLATASQVLHWYCTTKTDDSRVRLGYGGKEINLKKSAVTVDNVSCLFKVSLYDIEY